MIFDQSNQFEVKKLMIFQFFAILSNFAILYNSKDFCSFNKLSRLNNFNICKLMSKLKENDTKLKSLDKNLKKLSI